MVKPHLNQHFYYQEFWPMKIVAALKGSFATITRKRRGDER